MSHHAESSPSPCVDDITEVAARLGLAPEAVIPYGRTKAKVDPARVGTPTRRGHLILVTAISPTPAGEGKSTITIGLGDALRRLGHSAALCLREPSMGPVFGRKGGATGGGRAQIVPAEDINLHFTGDLHAITAANNLLCAYVDNHLYWGNDLGLDPDAITVRRCLDVNDRALRSLEVGRGTRGDRNVHANGFDITAASEIMAVLCLARDRDDLARRLGDILVGYTTSGAPVRARDLGVVDALMRILNDAVLPNLVQTAEGTPTFVHGGPFANIAHGTSSLVATRLALGLADYVVTEAGFGADLGAEKFLDIVCPAGEFAPDAVVLVATVRALKLHGGVSEDDLESENTEAVRAGLPNLARHLESLRAFGQRVIIAINRFATDTEAEIAEIAHFAEANDVAWESADVFARGGEGGRELAAAVARACEDGAGATPAIVPAYDAEARIDEKLNAVARRCYGAAGVTLTDTARDQLERLGDLGWDRLPICVAKTPASLTDDPTVAGAPTGFTVTVRELRPSLGAGFIVCLTGKVLTMPGLPRHPRGMGE